MASLLREGQGPKTFAERQEGPVASELPSGQKLSALPEQIAHVM